MSPSLVKLVVVVAVLSTPFAAHAQSIDRIRQSEAEAPAGYNFELGLSASNLTAVRTIEVYSAADHDNANDGIRFPRVFAARLSGGADGTILYTDSKKCPALYGVLEEMLDQTAVQISLPLLYGVRPEGAGIRTSAVMAPDGDGVTLWGRARQTSREPALVVVQSHGGRLAEVSQYANVALEPCWEREQPVP